MISYHNIQPWNKIFPIGDQSDFSASVAIAAICILVKNDRNRKEKTEYSHLRCKLIPVSSWKAQLFAELI